MQLIIIPFSFVSIALFGVVFALLLVKTCLFVKRFRNKGFAKWLYFSNNSIYSSGKKEDRVWKNFQNWLTWVMTLFAMLSLVFLFLSRS